MAIRATSGSKMDLSLTTAAIVGGTAVSLGAGTNNANASSNNNTSIGGKPGLISSTPSKNHTNAAAIVAGAGVIVPNSSGIVAPQQPPGVIVQPLIGPAFAAVAKQHPSKSRDCRELVAIRGLTFSLTFFFQKTVPFTSPACPARRRRPRRRPVLASRRRVPPPWHRTRPAPPSATSVRL